MHNTDPSADPEYVVRFKKRQEDKFAPQGDLDKRMLDLYLQKHAIEAKAPDAKNMAMKPVGSGLGGLVVDQDLAVLSGDVTISVIPRGTSKAERHASDVIEPFINASFKVMQKDVETDDDVRQDLRIFGRGWKVGPIPAPFFWADEDMTAIMESGTTKDIEEYKASHFPIVERHWPAPTVYPVFNDKGEPSEIICVRKMSADDIAERWGEDYIPAGVKPSGRNEEYEVVEYVNRKYIATIVLAHGGSKATVPVQFEHRMKTCPIVYYEGEKLPQNEYGWVWKGALFHLRELIHSVDETMTDIRTNTREYVTAPPMAMLNPELRGNLEGWPTEIKVEPGKTINLLVGETAGRWPVPTITKDAYEYISLARGFMDMVGVRRDALMGQGPSGESAVHQSVANQIAKAELKRPVRGIERAEVRRARLLLMSVVALSEGFPKGVDDAVTVRAFDSKHQSREISVRPDDVKGWEDLLEAHLDLNLPVNENANVTNYKLAVEAGMRDPYSARELYAGIQNPAEIDDRIAEHQMFMDIVGLARQTMLARAAGGMEKVGALPQDQLVQRAGQLPAFAQGAIQQSFAEEAHSTASASTGRYAANTSRQGRTQQPSNLNGNPLGG